MFEHRLNVGSQTLMPSPRWSCHLSELRLRKCSRLTSGHDSRPSGQTPNANPEPERRGSFGRPAQGGRRMGYGESSYGPPPRLAVAGQSSGHGPTHLTSDVTYLKSMLLRPMAAGPASRYKTGPRLSPHLAPSLPRSPGRASQQSRGHSFIFLVSYTIHWLGWYW